MVDQNYWTILHNSKTIAPSVMKFGHGIGVDDLEDDGHRSKNVLSGLNLYVYRSMH